jgi:phenylalanyl-tRNA synthetase alpha chain
MLQNLEDLKSEFSSALSGVKDHSTLVNLKADFLGKKGKLNNILISLKDATPEVRKTLGMRSNTL